MTTGLIVRTIGHSTRAISELIDFLPSHRATQLVDIRKMPRSRTNLQFNIDSLPAETGKCGIEYFYLQALSGFRRGPLSPLNDGWRNKSFRAYADYMQTPEFLHGLDELVTIAGERPTAIMCAEALPWRCHRSLVADALVVRGIVVHHLMSATASHPHALRNFARVDGTTITYPAAPDAVPTASDVSR